MSSCRRRCGRSGAISGLWAARSRVVFSPPPGGHWAVGPGRGGGDNSGSCGRWRRKGRCLVTRPVSAASPPRPPPTAHRPPPTVHRRADLLWRPAATEIIPRRVRPGPIYEAPGEWRPQHRQFWRRQCARTEVRRGQIWPYPHDSSGAKIHSVWDVVRGGLRLD